MSDEHKRLRVAHHINRTGSYVNDARIHEAYTAFLGANRGATFYDFTAHLISALAEIEAQRDAWKQRAEELERALGDLWKNLEPVVRAALSKEAGVPHE